MAHCPSKVKNPGGIQLLFFARFLLRFEICLFAGTFQASLKILVTLFASY